MMVCFNVDVMYCDLEWQSVCNLLWYWGDSLF